jgi:dTDP-4-dehydrorhamnose reductase
VKILITGAEGMLGRTLMRRLSDHDCRGTDIADCDLTQGGEVEALIDEAKPDVVIHCAAMTAVDDCETKQELAFAVNVKATGHLAVACHRHGARLVAISTDYVFDGDQERPYHEGDPTGPRTVYGQTKLAGEELIRAHCPNHVIARIAWLYGAGGPSFLHTMLRLGSQEGDPLKVVDDQIGNPTSTDAVAGGIERLLSAQIAGVVHLTCEGEATWFEFTREIFRLAGLTRGLVPCTTDEYPRPAPRPANSRLENRSLQLHGLPSMPTWQAALETFLREHPDGQ